MELYRNKVESGGSMLIDAWGPFRGKYPDPTSMELHLIFRYLRKFACEADDFVESKSFISLKNRLQFGPNLRGLFINFLRQVRGSKGYDVDLHFDFVVRPYTIFIPRSLDEKKFYDEAMAAVKFAVGAINKRMMAVGKSYKVVSVEKSVSATVENLVGPGVSIVSNLLLLTFTTQETIVASDADTDADVVAVTTVVALQAMVKVCDDGFQFKEWKYKPIF